LYRKTAKVGGVFKCNPVRVQNGNIKIVRNSGEVTSYQNREECVDDKNFVINDYLLDKHIATDKNFGKLYIQLDKNLADQIRELIKSKIEMKGNQYRTQVQKRHAIHTELEEILLNLHSYLRYRELSDITIPNVKRALKNVESSNNLFQFKKKYGRSKEEDWQAQQRNAINAEEYNLEYNNNWRPNLKIGTYPQTYSQPYKGNTITTNRRPAQFENYEEVETYL